MAGERGSLKFYVDVVQKPLDAKFKPLEDFIKQKRPRASGIFKVRVRGRGLHGLFGNINNKARSAARKGMMDSLLKDVLPDTPMNPEFHGPGWDATSDGNPPGWLVSQALEMYENNSHEDDPGGGGVNPYAWFVANRSEMYINKDSSINFNIFYELSGGLGDFFPGVGGHFDRSLQLATFYNPGVENIGTATGQTVNGRHTGPGVAGYTIKDSSNGYSAKNYRVYIYYGYDSISAKYAEEVHNDRSPSAGGEFLSINKQNIRKSVLSALRAEFKNVAAFREFSKLARKSFATPASKGK